MRRIKLFIDRILKEINCFLEYSNHDISNLEADEIIDKLSHESISRYYL